MPFRLIRGLVTPGMVRDTVERPPTAQHGRVACRINVWYLLELQ